jgi:hypothetical protein
MAETQTLTPQAAWPENGRKQRLVPDPVTGTPTPYQRTSTFAKTLDDGGAGLMAWFAQRVLVGASRPEMQQLVASIVESEKTRKSDLEVLAELGGSRDAAQKGTNRHEVLAAALLGRDLSSLPPHARAEVEQLVDLVRLLGSVEFVEFNTVSDLYRTAGTADLLLRSHTGEPIVIDFKTGKSPRPIEWAIQLIAHAKAWHWQNNQRLGPVAWAKPRLVILHAPQDGSQARMLEIDTDFALQAADLAVKVRDLRSRANKAIQKGE